MQLDYENQNLNNTSKASKTITSKATNNFKKKPKSVVNTQLSYS